MTRARHKNTRFIRRRMLILCEGQNTEPAYFRSLIQKYNGLLADYYEVDIQGKGFDPKALLQTARVEHWAYDRIWLVFDRDQHLHFDDVITKAEEIGIHCAWTNEAIELWFILHFEYLSKNIGRRSYCERLTEILKAYGVRGFEYGKSFHRTKTFIKLLQKYGNQHKAYDRAIELERLYPPGTPASACCPCTKLHHLIHELEHPNQIPL